MLGDEVYIQYKEDEHDTHIDIHMKLQLVRRCC